MKVVFAGPSFFPPGPDLDSAKDAIVRRGPARQGDVATAVHAGASAIAIVDGYYGTVAAVWHKEILYALQNGVAVVGGASLGAIRAAECLPFGMVGVGSVFDRYLSGILVDDGDVALLHAPAEMDYAPLTEALVDVEATLAAALRRGLLDRPCADSLWHAARGLFFWDRTMDAIISAAGYRDGPAERLHDLLESVRVRAKREDAVLVMSHLRALPDGRGARPAWPVSATRSYRLIATPATAHRV